MIADPRHEKPNPTTPGDDGKPSRGAMVIAHLRGKVDVALGTDAIMDMMRGG